MSYYVTNENSFLDIKNAHLRVTGNVHTDVLKLGAIEFQPTGSEVTGTVNFTNVTTGVTTSSNLNVGGTLQLGTVEVVATTHTLANTTALGNVTPHTIEVSNVTTGLVTTANVEVGRDLVVSGNVAVDTNTLFVDSVNNRVGIGTASPVTPLEVSQPSGYFNSMYIQKYLGVGPELATSYVLLLKSESSSPKRLAGKIQGVRGYSSINTAFEAEIIAGVGSGAALSGRMTLNYSGTTNSFYAKLVSLTYSSSTYIALALIPTANYNGMSGGIYFDGKTNAIAELQYITDLATLSNIVDFPISGGDKTTFTGAVEVQNLIYGSMGHKLLDEAELYYDPTRGECQDGASFVSGTSINDIKGNHPGTLSGMDRYNYFWNANSTSSCVQTTNNVDLRRDWTIMVWLGPVSTDFSNWRILGHGSNASNAGLHFQGADSTRIRVGFYSNDIDISTSTGVSNKKEWSCFTFTYYHNGGVAGGVDRKAFQNERLVGHQQGSIGDGHHFPSYSPSAQGSAGHNGHQPYQALPAVLRFGNGFSTGANGTQNQQIGPCVMIPRTLSNSEVRSLYRHFVGTFSAQINVG